MYSKKYYLERIEEFNKHKDMYDDLEGVICYPAYFKVGERGWFLYESSVYKPNRIHTSTIKNVEYLEGRIIVETCNTRFTFKLI